MSEREAIVAYLRTQAAIHARLGTVGPWGDCLAKYARLIEAEPERDRYVTEVIHYVTESPRAGLPH